MTKNKHIIRDNLFSEIENIISNSEQRDTKLQKICELLHNSIAGYDWVGFYFVDPNKEKELILGPYAGDTTEHTKINFGQGICGLAAEKEETIIVNDVSGESNYLSCNINVKSEIVLPIFKNNRIVGEFDLDSHTASRFNKQDKEFLSKIITLIIELF